MSIEEIRQQLHGYIDVAMIKTWLLIFFIEDKNVQPHSYTEEDMGELYRRGERFISGESKGYS